MSGLQLPVLCWADNSRPPGDFGGPHISTPASVPSDAGLSALSQQVAVTGELVTVCHHLQDLGDKRKPSLQLQGCCLLDLLLPHTPVPLELLFSCPSQVTKVLVPQPPKPLSSSILVLPAPFPVLSPADVPGEPQPAGFWPWSVPGAAVPTWGFSPALSPVLE